VGRAENEQQALKAKLERIIKLCDINKSHGSESADLTTFLGSLKVMVRVEQKNLEGIELSTRKIIEEGRAEYKRMKEQKQATLSKLKR
jgi:hypothetical protein